jgi:hypothetical protein
MALASIVFRIGPEPLPVVICHADCDVGGGTVRAWAFDPMARWRVRAVHPDPSPGGHTGRMVVIVAALFRTVSGSSGA